MAERTTPMDWNAEDEYWKTNYRTRPYASTGGQEYEHYRPGYRYGYEAANKYTGKRWEDVETNLRTDWDRDEHRGTSTWEQMKSAVRDAWDRVTGNTPVGARR